MEPEDDKSGGGAGAGGGGGGGAGAEVITGDDGGKFGLPGTCDDPRCDAWLVSERKKK